MCLDFATMDAPYWGCWGATCTLIWSLELWVVVFAVLSYAVYCEHISECKAMDHVLVISHYVL